MSICFRPLVIVCGLVLVPVPPPWLMDVCVCGPAGEIVIRLGGRLIRRASESRDGLNGGKGKHWLLGNTAVVEQAHMDLTIY